MALSFIFPRIMNRNPAIPSRKNGCAIPAVRLKSYYKYAENKPTGGPHL